MVPKQLGGRRRLRLGSPAARRYAVWIGTSLFLYSVLVFGIALVVPYIVPAATLISSTPLEERARAAEHFLMLADVFWPVCGTLLVGCLLLSVHLARRIAGPIFRLESFARGLLGGNLAVRIRLRESDELRSLSDLLDRAAAKLDTTVQAMCESEARAREAVADALEAARAAAPPDRSLLDPLEAAAKHLEEAFAQAERLRLSEPGEPR